MDKSKSARGHNFKTGYYCPECGLEGDTSPRSPLYEHVEGAHGKKVFRYVGLVKCERHGIKPGSARNAKPGAPLEGSKV